MFSHSTRNWQGVPLEILELVLSLVVNTRRQSGREVHTWLDEADYPDQLKVSDEQLSEMQLVRNTFHVA